MPIQLSRREALMAGVGVLVASLSPVSIRPALATPDAARARIDAFIGGQPITPVKMTLDIPEVAENGASVPVTILVDSPMTDADYVTDIMIVSEGNPQPGVATFQFSPLSGVAEVTTRVRLATTQTLHVLAKTSTGAVHAAATKVSVTVSGCVN